MAGADLHMAMGILSSAALAEQGRLLRIDPLLEELRIATRDVSAMEETPAGMIRLAGDARLAPASTRLRDILEAVLAGQLRSEAWRPVSAIFSFNSPLFRPRVIRELRSSLMEFGGIASSAVTPGGGSEGRATGQSNSNNEQPPAVLQQRERNPTKVDKISPAQLKVAKKMVRILLVDRVDDDGPLFLPLAGEPASGKSLLARTLFSDARVVERYVVRVWVDVSQCFDISKIFWEILNVADPWGYIFDGQAILKNHVLQALSKRRYLIVLDDAWSENVSEWHALMEALPSNGTVILTSRIPAVVSCVASDKPHPLKTMNKRLQTKFVHLWEARRIDIRYELAKTPIEGEVVLQRAHASYFHLPLDLRKCLLYCSVFPLGHLFDPEELADLLVAEGRISPTMTQAQRICFLQKLFDECFHAVEESENTTGKRTYWMHSIMHNFAKIVEQRTYWIANVMHNFAKIVERQSIEVEESSGRFSDIFHARKSTYIPTIYSRHLRFLNLTATDLRNHHGALETTNLRYLNLSKTDVEKIPSFVSKQQSLHTLILSHCEKLQILYDTAGMTNLRYLNLSRTDIEIIPRFVSKLQFLQTLILSHCGKLKILHDTTSMLVQLQKLDLEGCHYLVKLPPGLSKMKSLQFLNVHGCSSLTAMPCGMGQLLNLTTMLGYIASNNDGRGISELQPLANLKMLSLKCLENISNVADARDVKLQEKHDLESLTFRWNKSADDSNSNISEVLECLRPNQHLKTLQLVGYEGKGLPTWMTNRDPYLISLVVIRLFSLRNCETLPPLGLLPLLKIVEISGAETVTSISDSFYGSNGTFPSLQKLTFSYMSNLELWEQPHSGPVFPCLAEVTIIQCPKLALRVDLPSIKKVVFWMNNRMLYSSKGALGNMVQNLKHVSISLCQELIASSDCEGLQDLCRLKRLELYGCDEMTCLPRGLQHLSSLRSLRIMRCNKLETLPDWLANLSSLCLLCVHACPMLYSIPEVLKQSRYVRLGIKDCPKLPAQPLETAPKWYDGEEDDELFTDIYSDEFGVEESTANETSTGSLNGTSTDEHLGGSGSAVRTTIARDSGDSEAAPREIDSDLFGIVMKTPGFTDEQLFFAFSHLLDNEAIGKTFMNLPELGRVSWIVRFLNKHFQP